MSPPVLRAHSIKRCLQIAGAVLLVLGVLLALATLLGLRPLPTSLAPDPGDLRRAQVRDRRGVPLSVTYENAWNLHDTVALNEIPLLLQQAFIAAEDRRFYAHHGPDWQARLHALWQNLRAGRAIRGASTISEQAVRMLHPRPRTVWSRWLEGFEAAALERRFAKDQILEFYLNQVPYAGRRRGVAQAARAWFDRDLSTLAPAEMLTLAVMVRSPARLDPKCGGDDLRRRVAHLAEALQGEGLLAGLDPATLAAARLELRPPAEPIAAGHFVRFVTGRSEIAALIRSGRLDTTLDAALQGRIQTILDTRLRDLRARQVGDGAVLVLDRASGEILAWVNGGGDSPQTEGSMIDAILTPRQPGSALKPFLYAEALEKGWTAATLIDDAPLSGAVGAGLHAFRNYSRRFYGPLRLRECLGNSLNIPAVRTIDYVGPEPFLGLLHRLGFSGLTRDADFYGLGLALGNGEVSLFELTRAYATLANAGVSLPLSAVLGETPHEAPQRIFSGESASLIADILSDPEARQREFGSGSLLSLPLQTAVKTGTSTDYRDAWALGFNHRFVVGVWMGNLDRKPMQEITGALGPALVLRSVFAELNRNHEGAPLFLSPRLGSRPICAESGGAPRPDCPTGSEWFLPAHSLSPCPLDHLPQSEVSAAAPSRSGCALLQPTPGLQLAMDPRIPDRLEAFAFELDEGVRPQRVEWLVDGRVAGRTGPGERSWLWPLQRGPHRVQARVISAASRSQLTAAVDFTVK